MFNRVEIEEILGNMERGQSVELKKPEGYRFNGWKESISGIIRQRKKKFPTIRYRIDQRKKAEGILIIHCSNAVLDSRRYRLIYKVPGRPNETILDSVPYPIAKQQMTRLEIEGTYRIGVLSIVPKFGKEGTPGPVIKRQQNNKSSNEQ
jgi:hypothetical protein